MTGPAPSLLTLLRHSNLARVAMLFVLVILFQVPILALDSLIRERQGRRDAAVAEVAGKWGQRQSIAGPMLVVPYTQTSERTAADGRVVVREEHHVATFLPERLTASGTLDAEARRRGIFSTSVYRQRLRLEGEFARPSLDGLGIDPATLDWGHARLAVGVSDVRAIESSARVRWNGADVEVLPGMPERCALASGVQAAVSVPDGAAPIPFAIDLPLKGSAGAAWVPLGKTTEVRLKSNWPSPSFQGNWLPERRSVGPKGFDAEWKVAYLGRNFPQAWRDAAVTGEMLNQAAFGFDLVQTTDHYQMAARSVKYAGLFLLLLFATVWLVEVLGRVAVHPIQYLLLGSAMCVFYLLELSLSEHLGFGPAYLVATLAIVAQVAGYSASVLRGRGRGIGAGGMVAALFGYLYVVLTNEDYALLIGAVGVFAILAAIMYLTRRVDWYGDGGAAQGAGSATRV